VGRREEKKRAFFHGPTAPEMERKGDKRENSYAVREAPACGALPRLGSRSGRSTASRWPTR